MSSGEASRATRREMPESERTQIRKLTGTARSFPRKARKYQRPRFGPWVTLSGDERNWLSITAATSISIQTQVLRVAESDQKRMPLQFWLNGRPVRLGVVMKDAGEASLDKGCATLSYITRALGPGAVISETPWLHSVSTRAALEKIAGVAGVEIATELKMKPGPVVRNRAK